MEKTNTITVSRATAEKYKKLLAIDDISVLEDEELEKLGIVKDTTLFREGIEFKDKKYAELKVHGIRRGETAQAVFMRGWRGRQREVQELLQKSEQGDAEVL